MTAKGPKTSLNITRALYLIVCEMGGMLLAIQTLGSDKLWIGLLGGLIVCIFFIFVESTIKNFNIRGLSTGTFGLLVGILCAWLLTAVRFPEMLAALFSPSINNPESFALAFDSMMYASFGFLGAVVAIRTSHEDFAFVIPYVRFRQEANTSRPLLVDTDILCDGRLPAVMKAGFLGDNLILPSFALDELKIQLTSTIPAEKNDAERGMETLDMLEKMKDIRITVHSSKKGIEATSGDSEIIQIARLLNVRILTTDHNMTKIARLQDLKVINLDEINEALVPNISVGSRLQINLVRPGKDDHQAVGYLHDGTMVVVNNAISKMGTSQVVTVISTINTSAGFMAFADIVNV